MGQAPALCYNVKQSIILRIQVRAISQTKGPRAKPILR